jgi:hypothetical protein
MRLHDGCQLGMKELRHPPVDNDWRVIVCVLSEAWKKSESELNPQIRHGILKSANKSSFSPINCC